MILYKLDSAALREYPARCLQVRCKTALYDQYNGAGGAKFNNKKCSF
jgi:hypothetical protein